MKQEIVLVVVSWTPVWLASSSSGSSTSDCLFLCWKKDWICPLCLSSSLFLWVRLVCCVFRDGSATFAVWLTTRSMSWSARPVSVTQCVPRRNVSVPLAPNLLFDFDAISFTLQAEASAVTPLLLDSPSRAIHHDFLPHQPLKAASFGDGLQQG